VNLNLAVAFGIVSLNAYQLYVMVNPVGKIAKKSSLKCVFINSALKIQCHQNTVPYCQKYTPTDFFGDFAHWESSEALSDCLSGCSLIMLTAIDYYLQSHDQDFEERREIREDHSSSTISLGFSFTDSRSSYHFLP